MPTDEPVYFPNAGMHTEVDPLGIPKNAYEVGVNVRIEKQAIAQRHGTRNIPIISETEGLVEEFRALNWQGGIRFSPAEGQSAIQFSSKGEFILCAAAGRKFTLKIEGRGVGVCAILEEITGGFTQPADLHQIWLGQAENFAFAGDDFAGTWVWDSVNPAFQSDGYNLVDKEASRTPNRMRLPVYTHGRLAVTTDNSSVLIGNNIHGSNLTNASDLLKFTEQVYWATGQEFKLPTDAGAIVAAYNLPTLGNVDGHGDFVVEGTNKVYAIRTNTFPRESWSSTQMLTLLSAEGGARGQFAFDVYNNDSIRRTLRGIETLSFNKTRGNFVYDPQELLSDPVDEVLRTDYGAYLRFNSTKAHRSVKRIYSTIRPVVEGSNWSHRGMLSYNYKKKVWEGIWTFPDEYREIKQLIPMPMQGEQRMFMICGGCGGSIQLVEIDEQETKDVLLDGTEIAIQSQIKTRLFYGDIHERIEAQKGRLHFSAIKGDLDYSVSFTSSNNPSCLKEWKSEKLCNPQPDCENGYAGFNCLLGFPAIQRSANLGQMPGIKQNGVEVDAAKHFQFLVKWQGEAELRSFELDFKSTSKGENANDIDNDQCIKYDQCCGMDWFEYSHQNENG